MTAGWACGESARRRRIACYCPFTILRGRTRDGLRSLDQERHSRRRFGDAGLSRRCRGQGRQDRRDRQIVEPGRPHHRCRWPRRRARLYRQPLPLRRPGHVGPALHLLARARRDDGDLRQLLAEPRAGAQGHRAAPRRVPFSYVEAIPMDAAQDHRGSTGRRSTQYMDRLDNHLGINIGNLDRPQRGRAPLC